MRAREQAPLQRLGYEHLPTDGGHGGVQLGEETIGVAVGRDHDLVGLERLECVYTLVLT
jgi:hypothetical protein